MSAQVSNDDLALRIYAMANLAEVSKQLALEASETAEGCRIDERGVGVALKAVDLHWQAYDGAVDQLLAMILQGRVGGTVTQISMGRAS